MCMMENEKFDFDIPTISSFMKAFCKILGVSIPQNEETGTAKTTLHKIQRFNNNNLDKIINALLNVPQYYQETMSENEKELLVAYNQILLNSIEHVETIISGMQSMFALKKISKNDFFDNVNTQFIVPWIIVNHNQIQSLPEFIPITHLSDIASEIILAPSEKLDSVIRNYLRAKVNTLLIINKKERKHLKFFDEIKNIKQSAITSNDKIYNDVYELLIYLGDNENNKQEINKIIGAYSCGMMLLRLEKQLGQDLVRSFLLCLLKNIIFTTPPQLTQSILQLKEDKYSSILTLISKTVTSEDQDFLLYIYKLNKDIIHLSVVEFYFRQYLTGVNSGMHATKDGKTLYELVCDTLQRPHIQKFFGLPSNAHVIYSQQTELITLMPRLFNAILNGINLLLNIFPCFNRHFYPEFDSVEFLDLGIDCAKIDDKRTLHYLKAEYSKHLNLPYQKAVIDFIELILSIIDGEKDEAIKYCISIMNRSKTWHLGKIKSDTLFIYILLEKLTQNNYSKINSLLNQYYECLPNDYQIILTDDNKISDNGFIDIFNKSRDLKIKTLLQRLNPEMLDDYVNKFSQH